MRPAEPLRAEHLRFSGLTNFTVKIKPNFYGKKSIFYGKKPTFYRKK